MSRTSFKSSALYILLGCRWVLLLAALLLYSIEHGGSQSGAVLAITALAYFTFYSLSLLHYSGNRSRSVAVIFADLAAGLGLLYAVGGFNGALLGFVLSGLLMMKLYIRRKTFHCLAPIYLLLVPVIAGVLAGYPSYSDIAGYSEYPVFVLLFYIVVWAEGRATALVTRHMRNLAIIYASGPSSPAPGDRLPQVIAHTEVMLKRLLRRPKLWLSLDSPLLREQDKRLLHQYYANLLAERAPAFTGGYMEALSPVGDKVELYVQALRDADGQRFAWLIIQTEERALTWMDVAYIRLTLMRFVHHYETSSRFAAMQEQAVALERDAIAQDIHDGIAQELFFQSIKLFQLKKTLQKNELESAIEIVSEIEGKVKESHRQIREFIVELKGEKRKFNLRDAVESMLQRIVANSGVALDFQLNGWVARENIEIEEAIYHTIEEAANNVMKHAGAGQLFVRLEVTSVQWTVLVQDDGKGMDPGGEAASGKLGIRGMKSRVEALNGILSIQSEATRGTTVKAVIPRERSSAYV